MEYTVFEWNGFSALSFEFEGHEAVLVQPRQAAEGKPWLLKTEYFGAFPDLEIEMLRRGWHLAYIKNENRWGLREDLERKKYLRDYLVKEFGLSLKCVPVGMSCGGIFAIKLAGLYPEMVSVVYADAPVVNILSMMAMGKLPPDKMDESEIIQALSMSRSELLSYRDHPLDHLPKLVENRIPMCLVYGDEKGICADVFANDQEIAAAYIKAYNETMPLTRQVYKVIYTAEPLPKTGSGKIGRKENM